jgi:hypothetical protein
MSFTVYVPVTSSHLIGFVYIIHCVLLCSMYCSYVKCHLVLVCLGRFTRKSFLCTYSFMFRTNKIKML